MTAGLLQLRLGVTSGFRHIRRPGLAPLAGAAVTATGVVELYDAGRISLMVGYPVVESDSVRSIEGRFYFVLLMRSTL